MGRILTIPSECMYPTQDNVDGNLVLSIGDYILKPEETKYMVLELLGTGTFGQVFRCVNTEGNEVAIKVVKSLNRYFQYEMNELRILKKLKENSLLEYFAELYDAFIYKQHLCIVLELLGKNMYDLTRILKYNGVSYTFLRTLLKQLVEGLQELHALGIVHCDLKPENILLSDYFSHKVKIIDFGSSTTRTLSSTFYVQSRFYRAPEVILGIPYNSSIDIWSFGCVAYEIFTGQPLFPGNDNRDQILRIHDFYRTGLPLFMLEQGANTHLYFEKENNYRIDHTIEKFTIENMIEKVYARYGTREEHEIFVDFLLKVLNPSYLERAQAHTLLKHAFFKVSPSVEKRVDFIRVEQKKTLGEDSRLRKSSHYDFRSYELNEDFTETRKGSLFDPDHENRYNN